MISRFSPDMLLPKVRGPMFLQSVVLLVVLCHAEVFANESHMHDLLTTFKQFHTVFLDAPGHCITLLQRHPKQILFDTASRPQSFLITLCIRPVPNFPSRKTTVATRHGYGRNGRRLAGNVPVSLYGRLPGVLVMHSWSFDAFFNYSNADMTRTRKGHQVSEAEGTNLHELAPEDVWVVSTESVEPSFQYHEVFSAIFQKWW